MSYVAPKGTLVAWLHFPGTNTACRSIDALLVLSAICFSQATNIPKISRSHLRELVALVLVRTTITIHGDGSVLYEGRYYVKTQGSRKNSISTSKVQTLVDRLRKQDFFSWVEKKKVCVDFPEVDITVIFNGQHKRVLEGCNDPGPVLALADEIDRISGAKHWVGHSR